MKRFFYLVKSFGPRSRISQLFFVLTRAVFCSVLFEGRFALCCVPVCTFATSFKGVLSVRFSSTLQKQKTDFQLFHCGVFGQHSAARSVLLVAPDPDDEDGRVLASVKSNLAAPAQSLAFHIDQRDGQKGTHVVWDGISHLSKDDLLAAKPAKARQLAINFLKIGLADEPVPASEVEVEAKKLGIKERTLRRAADDLGVVKEHVGSPGGHWQWSLPETDGH